jgi:hypothetical protein
MADFILSNGGLAVSTKHLGQTQTKAPAPAQTGFPGFGGYPLEKSLLLLYPSGSSFQQDSGKIGRSAAP